MHIPHAEHGIPWHLSQCTLSTISSTLAAPSLLHGSDKQRCDSFPKALYSEFQDISVEKQHHIQTCKSNLYAKPLL